MANPISEGKTFESMTGLSTSCTEVMAKVELGQTTITAEAYRFKMDALRNKKMDWNTLSTGGFSAWIDTMNKEAEHLDQMAAMLKANDLTGDNQNVDEGSPSIFWIAKGQLTGEGTNSDSNPTANSANYRLVEHQLRDIWNELRNAKDRSNRWNQLSMKLRNVDAEFEHRYAKKKIENPKEERAFNAIQGKGGGKGKG